MKVELGKVQSISNYYYKGGQAQQNKQTRLNLNSGPGHLAYSGSMVLCSSDRTATKST